MSSTLSKRLEKVEAVAYVPESSERPTATEIWYRQLESVVAQIIKYPRKRSEPDAEEYDHFRLYAHQDALRTEEDVAAASDDVLLEALGLPNVENWGWLKFMVRELNWVMVLVENWGLPGLCGEYNPYDAKRGIDIASKEEKRAQAALYFLDLMRERGIDPLAQLRAMAASAKEKYQARTGEEIADESFIAALCKKSEWVNSVYTCESVTLHLSKGGEVKYSGDHRERFFAEIREAVARRRRHFSNGQQRV
jgi:hypothetical protein